MLAHVGKNWQVNALFSKYQRTFNSFEVIKPSVAYDLYVLLCDINAHCYDGDINFNIVLLAWNGTCLVAAIQIAPII